MPVCKDFVVRCNVGGLSLQRFHFFNGIFLGRWYPEGFHAKSMVLKRFAPFLSGFARGVHPWKFFYFFSFFLLGKH